MGTHHSDSLQFVDLQEIANSLKLPFKNLLLLNRALTHRSYLNEHPEAIEDNERLEFLGDAVLDFLSGDWLYNHFPEMAEGELTRMRSALVRTEQLAEFSSQLGLGELLHLGRGEEENGGRQRPSLLCAGFEALVGALYLDAGMDAVRAFAEPLIAATIDPILEERRDRDPKSVFQEWVQSQGYGPPVYHILSVSGPEHDKTFEVEVVAADEVYGRGAGSTKQAAAKVAARNALDELGLF